MEQLKLSQDNKHNRDKRACLDPDYANNHVYLIDGKSHTDLGYKTVTEYISQFFEKFDPYETIEKCYAKWQSPTNWKFPKYGDKTKEEIKDIWQKTGRDTAAAGTYMHRQFELMSNDEPCETELLECGLWRDWTKNHQVTPYRTEWTVFGEDEKIVGNVDLVFTNSVGEYCICDYKRTKPPDSIAYKEKRCLGIELPHTNESKHALQLNIYRYLIEKYYGIQIKHMYNLYIKHDEKDGEICKFCERDEIKTRTLFTQAQPT